MVNFRNLFYQLKKDYGTEISWVNILSAEADDRTGETDIRREYLSFNAVLLPGKMVRQFVQDIGYLAANKNFTYGGLNDLEIVGFVIDTAEVPQGMTLDLNGYINANGLRYDRHIVERIGSFGYLVFAKANKGSLPYSSKAIRVGNVFELTQRIRIEMN